MLCLYLDISTVCVCKVHIKCKIRIFIQYIVNIQYQININESIVVITECSGYTAT